MNEKFINHITDEIMALIPARGGSKSVPKKNIRLFNGHPLLAYSIAVAKLSKMISRVIISTDSKEIADVGKKYGAEVPFLRPSIYARDNSPDFEFVQHAIIWFYEHEGAIPRYIVHLRPTTPIRDKDVLDGGIRLLKNDPDATSLRSGHICTSPPYKWYKKGKDEKYLSPLMPNISMDDVNAVRQNFPDVYIPNGYVDVLKSEFIIRADLMHGDKMIGYLTEPVPDIDTEFDWKQLSCYVGCTKALQETLVWLKKFEGNENL